jgi:hypothetical protein
MEWNDVPQSWNDMMGKAWAPDGVTGKLPLVVYLHGRININDKITTPAARMIADDATLKIDKDSMSTGNLVGKLIKDGKIKPIIVAAPSETRADAKSSKTLFKNLDFASFVNEVAKKVKDAKMDIDRDKVAVVGWSGAGCAENNGLHKVAQEVGKGNYKLFLLGHADTCTTGEAAKRIQKALGSKPTLVYSIHEGFGGGGQDVTDEKGWISEFGVKRDLKVKGQTLPSAAENADQAAFELYRDDGDVNDPPTRTVARVAIGKKGLELHWSYFDMPARPNAHVQVPLVWSWYALQRFFKK